MPVTLTFDIEDASVADGNDRTRIIAAFTRLGWENVGGSAWRYPALGTQNTSEDWFNHVVPALMYLRSLTSHAGFNITKFTLDAHSEAGHRSNSNPPLGEPIRDASQIVMYPVTQSYDAALSEARLRKFIKDAADGL